MITHENGFIVGERKLSRMPTPVSYCPSSKQVSTKPRWLIVISYSIEAVGTLLATIGSEQTYPFGNAESSWGFLLAGSKKSLEWILDALRRVIMSCVARRDRLRVTRLIMSDETRPWHIRVLHNYIQCINSLDTIIEGKNIDDYMGLLRDYPEVTTSTTTLRSKTTGVSIDM